MTPITRREIYLAKLGGEDVTVPVPITRIEFYLAIICGGDYELPLPATRTEQYLYIIAGGNSEIPVPVTRIETYLAAIAGMEIDVPSPVTRTEYFLAQWMENAAWEWKTVTGSLLHITDALAGDVSALSVAIEPVQSGSGDPAPDNVRPISGWTQAKVTRTGKNLFDPTSTNTDWVGGNGSIYEVPGAKTMRIPVLPGQPLTISNANASSGTNILLIAYFDASGTMLARNVAYSGDKYKTATAPANTAYAIVGFHTWSESSQQQLEFGSTATAYEPYSGTTLTIDLDGTRYGGTLDVLTGVLTVDRVMKQVTAGTSYVTQLGDTTRFYIAAQHGLIDNWYNRFVICNMFSRNAYNADAVGFSNIDTSAAMAIKVPASYGISTASEANSWLATNKPTFVYALAAPQTVQLTPEEVSTLLGENNIWADTGSITMTYMADGETETIEALNLLLGNRYTPAQTEDDVPDKEALQIITGGTR